MRTPTADGGDLNTLRVPVAGPADRDQVRARRAAEPARFSRPVAHEPPFEVAAAHGYDRNEADVAAPTTADDETGRPVVTAGVRLPRT